MRILDLNRQNKRSAVEAKIWWIRYVNAEGYVIHEDGFPTREEAAHRLREVGWQIDDQLQQKQGEAGRSERE